MKAQLASDHVSQGSFVSQVRLAASNASGAEDHERAVYGRSHRANPVAAIASVLVATGAFASFLYIGGGHHHHREHNLTVMQLADLQPPPPPPPKAMTKVQPPRERAPEMVIPPPIIAVPSAPAPFIASTAPVPVVVGQGISDTRGPVNAPAPVAQDVANAGDLSAKMISATPPTYPIDARRAREQGTVVLAVMLSIDGRVSDIAISKSSGFESLDRAALRAVRHWRWSPMIRDGNAVLVRGLVKIPFILQT